MKIMIFGASGGTGGQLLLQALAAGHTVTAVVRDPDRFTIRYDRLHVVAGDALDPPSFTKALAGQDAVVSALGVTGFINSLQPMTFHVDTARAITSEMRRQGVGRLVAITSVGVLHDPTTPIWYRAIVRPLLRHKYADMRGMEEVIATAGLDWTIIRPVRLADGPLTQCYRIGENGNLPNGGAISRADVADFIVRYIDDPGCRDRAVALSY